MPYIPKQAAALVHVSLLYSFFSRKLRVIKTRPELKIVIYLHCPPSILHFFFFFSDSLFGLIQHDIIFFHPHYHSLIQPTFIPLYPIRLLRTTFLFFFPYFVGSVWIPAYPTCQVCTVSQLSYWQTSPNLLSLLIYALFGSPAERCTRAAFTTSHRLLCIH